MFLLSASFSNAASYICLDLIALTNPSVVKSGLNVVSEKEGIRAEEQEVSARITIMAQNNQMAPQKFLEELKKRDAVPEVFQQIIHEKVIDFLHEHAKIEDVPAGTLTAS